MDLSSDVASVLFGAALVLIVVVTAYYGYLLRRQRRLDDEEAAAQRADAGGPDGLVGGVGVRRGWLAIGFGSLCVAGPGWALVDVLRGSRFPDLLWAIPFAVGVAVGLLIVLEGIEKTPRRGWSGARVPHAG